jgi:hypothetical protein
MKTKFSELLKVKKQKLSEIEQQLAAKRYEKEVVVLQKVQIESEISAFQLPKEGDFSSMKLAIANREYLFKEKEHKENMIKYFEQEIDNLNFLYKEANIEYEKIKHLHEVEVEKMITELLKKESKQMDEIANQLFVRNLKKGNF